MKAVVKWHDQLPLTAGGRKRNVTETILDALYAHLSASSGETAKRAETESKASGQIKPQVKAASKQRQETEVKPAKSAVRAGMRKMKFG